MHSLEQIAKEMTEDAVKRAAMKASIKEHEAYGYYLWCGVFIRVSLGKDKHRQGPRRIFIEISSPEKPRICKIVRRAKYYHPDKYPEIYERVNRTILKKRLRLNRSHSFHIDHTKKTAH